MALNGCHQATLPHIYAPKIEIAPHELSLRQRFFEPKGICSAQLSSYFSIASLVHRFNKNVLAWELPPQPA